MKKKIKFELKRTMTLEETLPFIDEVRKGVQLLLDQEKEYGVKSDRCVYGGFGAGVIQLINDEGNND